MSTNDRQTSAPAAVGVVLVAAGSGQRLGQGIPKARVLCGGVTLLEHSLRGVIASGVAAHVVVVLPADDHVLAAVVDRAAGAPGGAATTVTSVTGGATRSASVSAGIAALPGPVTVVLVHDAARALTPPGVFRRVAAAVSAGATAVIPVLPVVDTVKVVAGDVVTATPDRSSLRAVQTPQGFDADALRAAHASTAAGNPAVTDDAMLMEARGAFVHVVDGDPLAFKVTTPLDLVIAEAVLARSGGPPGRETPTATAPPAPHPAREHPST